MKDKAFETIKEFCESQNLTKLHQRILLHKYYEDYYVLIEDYRKKEKTDPSEDTIKGFMSTLLNEMTLKTNIRLADAEIGNYTEKEISKIKKRQTFKSFGWSVVASIVGSILYTIILMLLFSMAHNQFKAWIDDLYNTEQHIDQKIKNHTSQKNSKQ